MLAAAGQGKDDPPPDDAKKAELRRVQAFEWLRADLSAPGASRRKRAPTRIGKRLKSGMPALWQEDSDLAGVRDADAVAKLPPDEQDAWRRSSGPTWTPS